jgi:hypothetical protein
MRIEAVLTKEDLSGILRQFAPSVIRLGEAGELLLDEPTEVALIPERGMRVVCSASLHWPLLGISVPVAVRSLAVMVCPVIETRAGAEALVFKVHIERVDITLLPDFFDDRVTARVNEELAKKHVDLSWRFAEMLSHEFRLPDALASTAALGLDVNAGTVRISDHAVSFAVSFQTHVERRAG